MNKQSTSEQAIKALGSLTVFALAAFATLALSTVVAFVGIEVLIGIDLNFEQALGAGLLLAWAS